MSAAGQTRLAVRSEPAHGESALGYALRLAELNCYEHWQWLLPYDAAVGASWLGLLSADEVRWVCRLGSADLDAPAKLGTFGRERTEVSLGGGLATPNQFIDRTRPKVCPACVAERGWLPWTWDLALWTACPVHGCWLVAECPGCKKRLTWNRARIDRCCSRTPLSGLQPMPAPIALVDLMRVMARACGSAAPPPGPALDALAGHLDPNQLAYLVVWLGAAAEWDPKRDRGLLARRPTFEVAARLGTAVSDMLADWPVGFHRLIERTRSARSRTGHPSTKKDFLHLANCFERQLAVPAFDFARLEFLAYVKRKHPWWRRIGDVAGVAAEPGAMIPLMQAAVESGLHHATMREWLRNGEIHGVRFPWGAKERWLVSRADLDRWMGLHRDDTLAAPGHLSRTEAGLALGVAKTLVPLLHEAGLIGGVSVRRQHRTLYSRASVVSLLERFDRLARSLRVGEVDMAKPDPAADLAPVTKSFGRGIRAAEVVRAVLESGTEPVALDAAAAGLRRYLFHGRELSALVRARRAKEGWIDYDAMRRALGCGHEVARFLVRQGYIEAVPAPVTSRSGATTGNHAKRISRRSLEGFVRLYVTTAQLKRRFGIAAAALRRLAKRHGVHPALTAPAEIWLRKDLARVPGLTRRPRVACRGGAAIS